MNLKEVIERAQRYVIRRTSAHPVYAFVLWYDGQFEIWNQATYEEVGREENCVAAVWSFHDDAGKVCAAVEMFGENL